MQRQIGFDVHPVAVRRWMADPKNPDLPLSKFIGNKEAIRCLSRAAFSAFGKNNHDCSDYSFALCGPPSTGKTHLTKLFAKSLELPFVVIEPQMAKTTHDIFLEIEKTLREYETEGVIKEELSLYDYGDKKYTCPPCIVFIDEVHNLKNSVVQGLLKATEPNDRLLLTEDGVNMNTSKICWMIATTDRGDLFDAFDTRFQKVYLRLYSKKEMASIIKINNPDWSSEICDLVANYNSQVPREALAFARDMRVEHEMNPSAWAEVAKVVAKDHSIDEFGMTYSRIEVLKALGQSTMSASQLPFVVHVKEEELKKYIMPPLLSRTPDQPVPFVTVCSKGYSITKPGLDELDKRNIPNRGYKAMPNSVRHTFEAFEKRIA
jgi:Holliday junction resolvasome RuvABC ATP-dependent DNA helicase subunit